MSVLSPYIPIPCTLIYSKCHNPSALHAQSQRDERTRRSKCTQRWLANEHFCEWSSSALCTQSTRSVRAVVPKNFGKYCNPRLSAILVVFTSTSVMDCFKAIHGKCKSYMSTHGSICLSWRGNQKFKKKNLYLGLHYSF